MTSKRMEKQPAVVMDATPKETPADPTFVDTTLCQCTGVDRWYEGDGVLSDQDGVKQYQCRVCGKAYHK
jgi:hypothetical protein